MPNWEPDHETWTDEQRRAYALVEGYRPKGAYEDDEPEEVDWLDAHVDDAELDEPCDCGLASPQGFVVHAQGSPGCEVNADGSLRPWAAWAERDRFARSLSTLSNAAFHEAMAAYDAEAAAGSGAW